MRVSEILSKKSNVVVSLPPTASPLQAAALIKQETVGAVLIRDNRGRVLGILSERDLAVAIADLGPDIFSYAVSDLMSTGVATAKPTDSVRDVMRIMTERRARHMPVVEGDRVVGVVSIGDILKSRLAEQTQENAVLHDVARAHLAA
jgi:CBS domain-containing protein